jgi:hypothetical protein
MNRSFSKIRHIQEANQRLEKRLMSEQVEQSGLTTTTGSTNTDQSFKNPFKDQSLLNKYVGKQFQTYSTDMTSNPNDVERYRTGVFEIYKVTPIPDNNVENRLEFDLGGGQVGTYSCTNGGGDVIHIRRTRVEDGIRFLEKFGDFLKAPSLTKDLKQTFCTTGSDGKIIAKVDYPTP